MEWKSNVDPNANPGGVDGFQAVMDRVISDLKSNLGHDIVAVVMIGVPGAGVNFSFRVSSEGHPVIVCGLIDLCADSIKRKMFPPVA